MAQRILVVDDDREIVRLLARRVKRAVEIAQIKVEEGIPLRSPDREVDLLADVREEAERLGLDPKVVHRLFEEVVGELTRLSVAPGASPRSPEEKR